jgi:hypothetical protein
MKYSISRWDSILFPRDTNPSPGIYIRIDDSLKNANLTSSRVSVTIDGTDSLYDGTHVATIRPSYDTGGYRPNFFLRTNTAVLVLHTNWVGYPKQNGYATLD